MNTASPLRITNPATGETVGEVPTAGPAAVAEAITRARTAQPGWAALPFAERARALRTLARAIRDDRSLVPTLIAESGKPRYEAVGMEVFYALEVTRYYTGRAGRRALRDERHRPFVFANKRSRVTRHPRGVVGVIGPWNWPILNNYADCVAPLMAGNAVVLKPSEHTPLTSLRVAELWRELGLPADVFQVVVGRGEAGRALVEGVDMIFFTGSAETGRQVAHAAAERLIPVVLELGGKSPMIVLADADLRAAAHAAVWSSFANSGQVCIRTERVLVEAPVAESFLALCVEEMKRLRQGHPANEDEETDVGAITFPPQIDRAERLIADAVARGGRVLAGGARRADLPGRYFAPTLIADATPEMAIMREETFGPVMPVMQVADTEEALRVANSSATGLSGSVWSKDAARAAAVARRLNAGSACVNDVLVNYFCVESPLGGMNGSGLGFRHGPEGIRQFCRIETIVEDDPLLGWLSPILGRELTFPYKRRTLGLLRRFMKIFY